MVDSSKPGVYTITYSAKDQAGNVADEAVRTVEVVDPTPPVISIARNTNSEVIISFKGKLELANTMKGPWEYVSEKSPLIINPNKEILFYRSVK